VGRPIMMWLPMSHVASMRGNRGVPGKSQTL
jgi:hypothetical protein